MSDSDDRNESPTIAPEDALGTVSEVLIDLGCVLDPEGRIVETLVEPTASMPVVETDQIDGESVETAFTADLDARLMDTLASVYRSGEQQRFRTAVEGDEGRRWVEVNVTPVDESQSSTYAMAVLQDVTEYYSEQQRLEQQVAGIASLCDTRGDLFFVLDEQGRITQCNEAFERATGYEFEDLQAAKLVAIEESTDQSRLRSFVDALRERGEAHVESEFGTCGGDPAPYEFVGTRFEYPTGDYEFVGIGRNISERRRHQQTAQRLHGHLDRVLDAIDDIVYIYDQEGRLQQWNRALNRVTGYTDEEIRGTDTTMFVPDTEADRLIEAFSGVLETGSGEIEVPIVTKSGEKIPYQFSANLVAGPDGEPVVCGIGRDITDRIEREEQIAVLSRALRHNVRNKMTVLSGQTEYLRESVRSAVDDPVDAAELEAHLARAQQAADSLLELSENCFQLTRIVLDHDDGTPIDCQRELHHLVEETRTRYSAADIDVRIDGTPVANVVARFGFAIAELLENACQHNDEPTVSVTARESNSKVTITVEDDGSGLPRNEANVVTRAEPETPIYHGSGMGLCLVRWIVTLSGGTISHETPEGGGTRFVITVDAATEAG